ncbi:hypothetical protein AAVH_14714 [Aphelenchoides avenae]|nr:hypothetical protein AAVH_14714 [Aphelenchus avenae]
MKTDLFTDRREAGRKLAERLQHLKSEKPVVLALPRGGVPLAYEVAKVLEAPLDLLMVRKIGAPGHEEYGVGAVVDGASPQMVLNEEAVRMLHISREYLENTKRRELDEIVRRRAKYLKVGFQTEQTSHPVLCTVSTVLVPFPPYSVLCPPCHIHRG